MKGVLLSFLLLVCAAGCTFGERSTTEISGEKLEQRFADDNDERWTRGELAIGEPCEGSADCYSGLCIGGFCTQDCTSAVCPGAGDEGWYLDDGTFIGLLGSQCTTYDYPCDMAWVGALAPEVCLESCDDAEARLCMRACERELDCTQGTDCVRSEDGSYSCLPWVKRFEEALACIGFTEITGGAGTPPDSCLDEEAPR